MGVSLSVSVDQRSSGSPSLGRIISKGCLGETSPNINVSQIHTHFISSPTQTQKLKAGIVVRTHRGCDRRQETTVEYGSSFNRSDLSQESRRSPVGDRGDRTTRRVRQRQLLQPDETPVLQSWPELAEGEF